VIEPVETCGLGCCNQPTAASVRTAAWLRADLSVAAWLKASPLYAMVWNVQRIEPLRTSYAYVPGRKTGATDDEQVAVRDARSYVGDGQ
jgi:hypothetical protein